MVSGMMIFFFIIVILLLIGALVFSALSAQKAKANDTVTAERYAWISFAFGIILFLVLIGAIIYYVYSSYGEVTEVIEKKTVPVVNTPVIATQAPIVNTPIVQQPVQTVVAPVQQSPSYITQQPIVQTPIVQQQVQPLITTQTPTRQVITTSPAYITPQTTIVQQPQSMIVGTPKTVTQPVVVPQRYYSAPIPQSNILTTGAANPLMYSQI